MKPVIKLDRSPANWRARWGGVLLFGAACRGWSVLDLLGDPAEKVIDEALQVLLGRRVG
jgi:hypothetical protein